MAFGYYDELTIHAVSEWYDFRPKGLQKRQLQVDLDTPFIDQYTIRAFVPLNSKELDEKEGFAYDF